MPIYDKAMLGRKAGELGFTRDSYEKMSRLTEILKFLNAEQDLKALLALKGGAAINLAVFNLPRLSVDIDLDFSENLSREETAERRRLIHEVLGRYMNAEGYILRDKTKRTHALDSYVFSYTNAAGNPDNIKIEINYMLRCHALPAVDITAQAGDVFSDFSIRTLAPVEIFSSKIVALGSRAAARDLYDINNMVYYKLFDESELVNLRKCAVLYLAISGDTQVRGFSTEKVSKITERKIRTDLFPMIRNAERFDFAAAKERVISFLSELMKLSEKEISFLARFSAGHYEPELLFEEKDILDRIANHPMAAWRTQRIKEPRAER